MIEFATQFFERNPDLELRAVGARIHKPVVDLEPYGIPCQYLDAENHPDLVRAYYASNRQAFPDELSLPGWVLADLYLLPALVGLLVGDAGSRPTHWPLEPLPDGKAVLAAYYAAPSLTPGLFIGVSLLSAIPGVGAGSMVKALTLRVNRAARVRGISKWDTRAIRSHVKVGPMRIVTGAPGPHEHSARSFVYETRVDDEQALSRSLEGKSELEPTEYFRVDDPAAIAEVLKRSESGECLAIVAPGVDDQGRVCLAILP